MKLSSTSVACLLFSGWTAAAAAQPAEVDQKRLLRSTLLHQVQQCLMSCRAGEEERPGCSGPIQKRPVKCEDDKCTALCVEKASAQKEVLLGDRKVVQ